MSQPTKVQRALWKTYQWSLRVTGRPPVPPCGVCAKTDEVMRTITNHPHGGSRG